MTKSTLCFRPFPAALPVVLLGLASCDWIGEKVSKQGWSLTLSNSDGPDKVAEFYEFKLTGSEKEASLDPGAMKTRHLKGADRMVVNVVAAAGKRDGQTGIQLSVNKPKPKP